MRRKTNRAGEPAVAAGVSRREFISSAAVVATGITAAQSTLGQDTTSAAQTPPVSLRPSAEAVGREHKGIDEYSSADHHRYFVDNPGSDQMVDVLRKLDIDFIAVTAGSSFRGLQESVVTYGKNKKPELINCLHEEQAVALAHGYAKVAGKPAAALSHGTVGLQHAAMAVYNAWCDRVPVILLAGNHLDANERLNSIAWVHSAQDAGAILRDFTKWDDAPRSLPHCTESMLRAYKIATTVPMGPTLVVIDAELQERPSSASTAALPRTSPSTFPQGDDQSVAEAAKRLAAADHPLIIVDNMARDQVGVDRLVELAELLQAPVIDKGGRMNFPFSHYLNQSTNARRLVSSSDVILALEVADVWGSLSSMQDTAEPARKDFADGGAQIIVITSENLFGKSNYQDFQRYFGASLSISADGQTTLKPLIDAVRRARGLSPQTEALATREKNLREAASDLRTTSESASRAGWHASPITMARLCADLWDVLQHRDFTLASSTYSQSNWPQRLWTVDKYHQFMGWSGGAGIGYGMPAAVGIALANRGLNRVTVNIQGDGDLMMAPAALWTAAHHKIPLLTIVHNNGGYHQELMHLQKMASRRQRGADGNARIGTMFDGPSIDYAKMAQSMGVWAEGPIRDPSKLAAALRRAIAVVDSGAPALLDVVSQPR